MEKNIIIKDGTSRARLFNAISKFEIITKTTVLIVNVYEDHSYILIEFDGIVVTKWTGNIDDFIKKDVDSKMSIVEFF